VPTTTNNARDASFAAADGRADACPTAMMMSALVLVGSAMIPMALGLLGVNLRNSGTALLKTSGGGGATSPPESPAPGDDAAAFKRLRWLAVVVRQSVCPAIILTLFLELSAPTAIAASLLCNMHDFMPADFASGLFIQYIAAVPIATFWISFTLWYIDAYCSGA
jgi:hypothetical protein